MGIFAIASGCNNGNSSSEAIDSDTIFGSSSSAYTADTQTERTPAEPDTENKTENEVEPDAGEQDVVFIGDSSVIRHPETTLEPPDDCGHPEVVERCEEGWCRVEPGCFLYGSPPTAPCRAAYSEAQVYVTLTHPYVIAQTEVTQAQWEAAGLPNPSLPPLCADCPVTMINWYETLVYCNALSEREGLEKCYGLSCCEGEVANGCLDGREASMGKENGFFCECDINRYNNVYDCPGYRLPTAAEWEYAARAGTTTETYIGDSTSDGFPACEPDSLLDRIAWYCGNTDVPMPVAQKEKNGWGLYDMLGNVYEWASDPYNNTAYGKGETHRIDPYGFVDGESPSRPKRSCSFLTDPSCIQSARNLGGFTDQRSIFEGFRPVRTLFE